MSQEEELRELVARVISKLAQRLGATGERGLLVVVFTAATVGFGEAVQLVRELILDGFRVQLAFSRAARKMFAKAVTDQLDGFPHVTMLEASSWLGTLKEAHAVVVPLLSLNTLSKLSLLIADNIATNLILHGLLMGKPVVVAQNGADPRDAGRQELGFHKGRSALARDMVQRLEKLREYGCAVSDVGNLGAVVNGMIPRQGSLQGTDRPPGQPFPSADSNARRFITAAEVLHAWHSGTALDSGGAVGMTPLARELALRHGVVVSTSVPA